MRILIAEDDSVSRRFLEGVLSQYGECDFTFNGIEVVEAFMAAWEIEKPYDLICLDIMMPKVDGIKALKAIRDIEKHKKVTENARVKILMITAISDADTIASSYENGCEAFIAKPIEAAKLSEVLRELGISEVK